MKIFIDSANVQEIQEVATTGLIDGVTTNPSLIAKSGHKITEIIAEITDIVPDKPVSAEVTAMEYERMLQEAEVLRKIADNVAIKVPLTMDGLKVCKALSSEGTMVNVTLCFTVNQALLAAKAGASFISPFIGRLDDMEQEGIELINDIVEVYSNYPELDTEILAASIRGPKHVKEVALIGADIATIPVKTFQQMYNHPLTDSGLTAFLNDWKKTGQSIL